MTTPLAVPRTRATALEWLAAHADERAAVGLRRTLRSRAADSAELDLAGNDYLGLSRHPEVIAAAAAATAMWGTGATGSRLVSGNTTVHEEFERQLAEFTGHEAALLFSSGYLANLGALQGLAGRFPGIPDALVLSDAGSHASLIDGCRLSRAEVRVFARGNVAELAAELVDARRTAPERRILIATDSVYSADGLIAPIREIADLAGQYDAMLIVDEAHGLGVMGPGGRGVTHELIAAGRPGAGNIIVTATLSKALGGQGGVVLAAEAVRAHLIDAARSFMFDTGLTPAAAAGAGAALAVLRGHPELPGSVHAAAAEIAAGIAAAAPDVEVIAPQSAVVAVIIGDPRRAVAVAERCRELGVSVGCFRPPSVPEGTARLRITARADLTAADRRRVIETVAAALEDCPR